MSTAIKTKWYTIQLNVQNVLHETEKATLFAMPHKSDYDGFQFWHPAKLVRYAGAWMLKISFTKDFEFRLKKMGQGKYNWKIVIAEETLSAEDFALQFGIELDEEEE